MPSIAMAKAFFLLNLSMMLPRLSLSDSEQSWSLQRNSFYVAPVFPPSFSKLMEIRAPQGVCWFTCSECVKHPHFSKRLVDTGHRDMQEHECFALGARVWRFCENPVFVPVAMLYPERNSSVCFPDEGKVQAAFSSVDFRTLSAGYADKGSAQITPDLDTAAMRKYSPGVASMEETGWKTVHLWVGASSYRSRAAWNGQFQQDKLVVDIFGGKTGGFFVDLAASDAIKFSNTLTLEQDFGWEGLCIEANEQHIWGLSHRRCQVIQAMIGSSTGDEYTFALSGWCGLACAGIADPGFDAAGSGSSRYRRMRSVAMDHLLLDFQAPSVIDYLSLDVEGAEDLVLSSFPFEARQVLSLSIERPSDYAVELLTLQGFHFLCRFPLGHPDGYDEFWVHASIPNFHHIAASWGEAEPDREHYATT